MGIANVGGQNLQNLPKYVIRNSLLKRSFCQFSSNEMAVSTEAGKSFARRDRLLEIEAKVRDWWEEKDVFRAESCEKPRQLDEKFFGNFPFPYMNGFLHLGHAFSLSKLEFAAAYHRLRGANVLLPFGFHGTGMPIKASADKLAREIQQFGNPASISYYGG
ncbi:hypothetical protein F0562_020232 [Nyssa sinensis]|uniref:leucine--tRNA ligase n=1 Tax=Nyssa sinensis TaxID=561372 RepID=A0A5J5BRE5_9ASTE|nr:hypothetical protein F0562_020232 [Nyssa sinensis]